MLGCCITSSPANCWRVQVKLGSVGQQIPVVHTLPAAVGPEHLGDQQFAAEQVVNDQGSSPALAAGRVGRGPVISVDRIAGVERPGRADRSLEIMSGYVGHDRHPSTAGQRRRCCGP